MAMLNNQIVAIHFFSENDTAPMGFSRPAGNARRLPAMWWAYSSSNGLGYRPAGLSQWGYPNSWMVHGTSWKLLFLPEWNIMKTHGTFLDGDGKSFFFMDDLGVLYPQETPSCRESPSYRSGRPGAWLPAHRCRRAGAPAGWGDFDPSQDVYDDAHKHVYIYMYYRRKFRSQTSDNMDRWKAELGRVREEESRREKVREEKESEESTLFFQWFVAPEGRKVGSLKRRVRSHLARWEMKRHTVAARSTFRSQHVQSNPFSEHQSARRCGRKHVSKPTCTKHFSFGALLGIELSKSACRCGVKHISIVLRGRRKGFCALPKVGKTWGFCSMSKNDGRRGTFEEDLARCISHGRRSTRDMFTRDARRSGRWFPERDCILENQIFSFGKIILRDRCSTSYDLALIFRVGRNTLET